MGGFWGLGVNYCCDLALGIPLVVVWRSLMEVWLCGRSRDARLIFSFRAGGGWMGIGWLRDSMFERHLLATLQRSMVMFD